MPRKLLIVNQWTGYLWVDIANAAAEVFDEVIVMAGKISVLERPLSPRISVVEMPVYLRRSLRTRFGSWVKGFGYSLIASRTRYRDFDVLVSTNPPLLTWFSALLPNRVSIYAMDLYPEALYLTSLVDEDNPAVRMWQAFNRVAYSRFKNVFVMTKSMQQALAAYGCEDVVVVPPWSGVSAAMSDAAPPVDVEAFRARHGLKHPFLVTYSGNVGQEHNLSVLVETARALAANRGVGFVVAGDGGGAERVRAAARDARLSNMYFLPFQSSEDFRALMAATSVGVVAQSERSRGVCIPSKTFNLLALGKPILAIGGRGSELDALLADHQCGRLFEEREGAAVAEFLGGLARDEELTRAYERAAVRASQAFGPDNARTIIASMVETCA